MNKARGSTKNPSKSSTRKMNGFEEWGGYMAAKKSKLEGQFKRQTPIEIAMQVKQSNIFEGISIYINGYTKPSAEELKRLMMVHGGAYHYYNTSSTTHMVATNLPTSKVKCLKDQKVVTPDWITDSINAMKLLPYTKYLLYKPQTFNQHTLELVQNVPSIQSYRVPIELNDACSEKNHLDLEKISPANFHDDSKLNKESTVALHTHFANGSYSVTSTSKLSDDSSEKATCRTPLKAGDPGFISEFYSHSRLHHISTAGQDLKLYVQQIAANQQGKHFSGRDKLKNLPSHNFLQLKESKIIMHLDMDCFFVSVGLKKYPDLRGQPVAVTHSKGRHLRQQGSTEASHSIREHNISSDEEEQPLKVPPGSTEYGSLSEIASCNYEARQAGLRNGMFLGEALKRCPSLKTIPYDFEGYTEVSKILYDIVASFTLDIEAVSCDELYIDCTELLHCTKVSPSEFALFLRNCIYGETGCTASAGIGSNMLLARLATRLAKPNGQFIVCDSNILEFITSQNVKNLPGVGYTTSLRLEELGVQTCRDLQKWTLVKLQQEFGPKNGQRLFQHCRGRDDRTVSFDKDRKSVSSDINYAVRLKTEKDLHQFIQQVSAEIEQKLKKIKKRGRGITLKVMIRKRDAPVETEKFLGHGSCDSFSKSTTLLLAVDESNIIANECSTLARAMKIPPHDLRGLGIQVSKLEPSSCGSKSIKKIDSFVSRVASSSSTAATSAIECKNHSELDQSVLKALPEELRQEVLSSYSAMHKVSKKNSYGSNSPMKNKQEKLTRQKTKGTKLCDSNQRNISKYYEKDQSSTKADFLMPLSAANHSFSSACASLIGVTDVDEVRSLVREWIESGQCPAEDDIEEFKNYLVNLVEQDLEKTNLVIKYFYRLASSASELWKESYLLILSYVQQKMLHEYGYMLKAQSEFCV